MSRMMELDSLGAISSPLCSGSGKLLPEVVVVRLLHDVDRSLCFVHGEHRHLLLQVRVLAVVLDEGRLLLPSTPRLSTPLPLTFLHSAKR